MSEVITEETQAVPSDESQVDTTNQQPESPADEVQSVSLDELKKVRSEAANLRKRLKEAEGKVSQFETANQSDEERRSAEFTSLQERAERAERDLQVALGRNELFSMAVNAVDPEVLYRFIKDDIEYGDDNKPANLKELVDQARESRPSLFHRGSVDGAPRTPSNSIDMNAAFRKLRDETRGKQ